MTARRLVLAGFAVGVCVTTAQTLSAQAPKQVTPPWAPAPVEELPLRITDSIAAPGFWVIPTSVPGRVYYHANNEIWLYDRVTRKSTVVADGCCNTDLSPKNDRLVFLRGDKPVGLTIIYTMPVDPKTGLPAGPARRLALSHGDQPRFSPDGKWIAFCAYDSASANSDSHIAIVSADGGTERAITQSMSGIGFMHWSPDGRTIYFSGSERPSRQFKLPTIYRVSAGGGKLEPLGQTGGRFQLSPNGNEFLVMAASEELFALLGSDFKTLARVRVPRPFTPDAWISDNVVLVAGGVIPTTVHSLSIDDGSDRELVPARYDVERLFWAPDGKRFATLGFATSGRDIGNGVVYVVNADGSGRRQLGAAAPIRGNDITWSPDGRFIVVGGPDGTPLNVIDVASGSVRRIGYSLSVGRVQWRKDSQAILFTRRLTPDKVLQSLFEVTLDGKERTIGELPFDATHLEIVNDSIALISDDSGVVRISLPSGSRKRVATFHAFAREYQWDRAGTRLAIGLDRSQTDAADDEVEVFDASGKREAQLQLPCRIPYLRPRDVFFHPDGTRLIAACTANGRTRVYSVPISGGDPRKIADLSAADARAWVALSPDGKQLLYTVHGPELMLLGEVTLPPRPRK